jgi:hypothetical protein
MDFAKCVMDLIDWPLAMYLVCASDGAGHRAASHPYLELLHARRYPFDILTNGHAVLG